MNTYASIAFRNLNRQKKRSFLLGGAIAFGIMIVTLINGFAGSLSPNLSRNFANLFAGHVFLSGKELGDNKKEISVIRDDAALSAAVAPYADKIKHITRHSGFYGTLIFEGKKVMNQVSGADLTRDTYLNASLKLVQGDWASIAAEPRALVVSEPIVKKLNIQLGDRVLAQMETINGQGNVGEFVLMGITRDTGIFGSMQSYAQLPYVSELIGLKPGEYQTMGLLLKEFKDTEPVAALVYADVGKTLQVFERKAKQGGGLIAAAMNRTKKTKESWEGVKYSLSTIIEQMSQVDQIVAVLDGIGAGILIVLFVIIMVGIMNTFRMVMYERIREIGTMRAIGIRREGIRSMFLYEALFLAIGGAIAGIIVALILMGGFSLINFGEDSPLFILLRNGHLSFYLPPMRALGNIAIIAVLTLIASLAPAVQASKLSPAVALRTQK